MSGFPVVPAMVSQSRLRTEHEQMLQQATGAGADGQLATILAGVLDESSDGAAPAWSADPVIDAEPAPDWNGDPGVSAWPEPAPGVEWPPTSSMPSMPPAAVEVPAPTSAPDGPWQDRTTADLVGAGARGFLVPSLVGGAFSGLIAAAAAKGSGMGGAMFAAKTIEQTLLGVAAGAGAGLLVAASSPREGDSLPARYAVAGALTLGATGALSAGGGSRGLSTLFAAGAGAVIGGVTGSRLEQRPPAS